MRFLATCKMGLESTVTRQLKSLGIEVEQTLDARVIFTGDGIPVFAERMKELLKCPYSLAPAHMSRQRAASDFLFPTTSCPTSLPVMRWCLAMK